MGIKGVTWYLDDILIGGKTHGMNIFCVKKSSYSPANIWVKNSEKLIEPFLFRVSELTFLGHKIDKNGIHPTAERIEDIK